MIFHRFRLFGFDLHEMRLVPAVLGLGALLIAERASALDAPNYFFDVFWSWWLIGAGVSSLLFAWKFTCRHLMALSGSMLIVGFLARAFAVLFRMADSLDALSDPQLHIAGAVYTLLSSTIFVLWVRLIGPAVGLERALERAKRNGEG